MVTRKNGISRYLPKAPTGIHGLDEITGGGFPRGRPTLVCGGAGCGKTLLAMEFLVRGAVQYDEAGVFMTFEETEKDLAANVASLGFNLKDLVARKKLSLDHVHIERSEIEETGEFNLDGLFIRLEHAIDSIGAKRVVLDTVESLFSGLSNQSVLRPEIRRLFHWLKRKGVTAVITGERGEGALTRNGLEEYVSDCVILLDHRVTEQISTRRLRVVKYRGSTHGTNEYPFLIDESGISVLPITSMGLQHNAGLERVSSGLPELDQMLGEKGFYRGTTILVSGTAGTGKSSVAARFADAACRRGERVLYFAFEESPGQILRNMRSVGINLLPWVDNGRLTLHASRPTVHGLELHLLTAYKLIHQFKPDIVILDPITSLISVGSAGETNSMLVRLIDFLKSRGTTAMFTSLTHGRESQERTNVAVSSLIDTWILLSDIQSGGERNRTIHILKSRGMAHSNQVRELLLTSRGIRLIDIYLGAQGMLTGSARLHQATKDREEEILRQVESERRNTVIESRRKALEAQIESLRAEAAVLQEAQLGEAQERGRTRRADQDGSDMAKSRNSDQRPVKRGIRNGH